MPNRSTRIIGGLVCLVIVYYLLNHFGWNHLLSYAITIFVGSIFPDIIEQATFWKHRQFFHSKTILKYLSYALIISIIPALLYRPILYLTFFILGYIIHLLMDWTTPMGLPDR